MTDIAFTSTAKDLLAALSYCGHVLLSKSMLQILEAVYIESNEYGLRLRSSNITTTIITNCAATVAKHGVAAIPLDKLRSFVSVIDRDASVRLQMSGRKCAVTSQRAKAAIDCYDPEEYPSEPAANDRLFEIQASRLLFGVTATLPAVSDDSTRPILGCLCFDVQADGLTFASADGSRLHTVRLDLADGEREPRQILVPKAVATILAKLFDPKGVPISLSIAGTRQLALQQGDRTLISSTAEGTFPPYPRLISESVARTFTAKASDWAQAIKVASVFSDRNSVSLTLTVPAGSGQLDAHLTAEAESDVAVTASEGEESSVILDYRYFGEVFGVLPADMPVEVGYNSDRSPLRIAWQHGDTSFTGILMPMHENAR